MAHELARLKARDLYIRDQIQTSINKQWTRNPNVENARLAQIAEKKETLLKQLRLIGRICVQYNLPSGDPPPIPPLIASYV